MLKLTNTERSNIAGASRNMSKGYGDGIVPNATSLRKESITFPPKVCQWIDGDPRENEDDTFCGAPIVEGKSWCKHHLPRVFYTPEPRKPV